MITDLRIEIQNGYLVVKLIDDEGGVVAWNMLSLASLKEALDEEGQP